MMNLATLIAIISIFSFSQLRPHQVLIAMSVQGHFITDNKVTATEFATFISLVPGVDSTYSGPPIRLEILSYDMTRRNTKVLESTHVSHNGSMPKIAQWLAEKTVKGDTIIFSNIKLEQLIPPTDTLIVDSIVVEII